MDVLVSMICGGLIALIVGGVAGIAFMWWVDKSAGPRF